MLSEAYLRVGQYRAAVESIERLVRHHPDDAALRLRLGRIDRASGDARQAVEQYLSAAGLDDDEDNLFSAGIGLISLGAAVEAESLFLKATGSNPSSAKLWMGLGIAQSLRQDEDQAAQSLLKATDLDPDYQPPYLFLTTLAGTSAESDDRIRARLEKFTLTNPEYAEAHYQYALVLWKQAKQAPSAGVAAVIAAQLKLAIARNPRFVAAYLKLGAMYQHSGDYADASGAFERALQIDPSLAAAHYRLAQCYQRLKRPEAARLEMAKYKATHVAPGAEGRGERRELEEPGMLGLAEQTEQAEQAEPVEQTEKGFPVAAPCKRP